jgi:CRISPR-associated protein Csc2
VGILFIGVRYIWCLPREIRKSRNLRWTQAIYDAMKESHNFDSTDPLNEESVLTAATSTIEALMTKEFIVHTDLLGTKFTLLLDEVKTLLGNEDSLKQVLQQADQEAKAYFKAHIEKPKKADKDKEKATK